MKPRYARLLVTLWCTAACLTAHLGGIATVYAASAGAPRQTAPTPAADFVKSLQRELKRAGYDPGATDGRMGPSTRQAVKRFQEAHGLPPTGDPDIPTLTKLLAQGLPD